MLAEYQVGFLESDIFRTHDLVGRPFLQHAVLMNACFVRESISSDDSLVSLNPHTRDRRNEATCRDKTIRNHLSVTCVMVAANSHGHHHFFERAVPGSFADAIDGALNLPGAGFDGGETVGNGHPQIVMAVHTDHGTIDVRDTFFQGADDPMHLQGGRVTDGVGNIDGGRPGFNRFFDDLAEEVEFGSGCVFGRELDVVAILNRVTDTAYRSIDDFVRRHLQLEFAVNRAGGEENVNPRIIGVLERIPGSVDVFFVAACQSTDRGASKVCRDFSNGFIVTGRSDGKPGFNDVDTEIDQGLSDLQFFGEVHAAAR